MLLPLAATRDTDADRSVGGLFLACILLVSPSVETVNAGGQGRDFASCVWRQYRQANAFLCGSSSPPSRSVTINPTTCEITTSAPVTLQYLKFVAVHHISHWLVADTPSGKGY